MSLCQQCKDPLPRDPRGPEPSGGEGMQAQLALSIADLAGMSLWVEVGTLHTNDILEIQPTWIEVKNNIQ